MATAAEQKNKAPAASAKQWAFEGARSGLEGFEDDLGANVQLVLRTMLSQAGYKHGMNDALIKARLQAMQFAKDHNMMDAYVEHDINTMAPINARVKAYIEKTGDKEAVLVGLCERTACHYQLVLETESEPGMRRWKSPWGVVLDACKRMKMFDLTEEEIHETWYKPRAYGYADAMGVKIKVSDWNDDAMVTVEIVED